MMAARTHICELASTFAMPFLSVQTLEARPPFQVNLSVTEPCSFAVIIGTVGLACRASSHPVACFRLQASSAQVELSSEAEASLPPNRPLSYGWPKLIP
ncbi:hypothetical protein PF005_g12976 [Phytophthora fragariae]|uniref:Uncharacterized protein n=2 Tax=Phytophthora TaxID=4783 RepID=A0A6A3XQ82_9STRA|nr:hypothetical protein PF003_g3410 [Phytophthora fragariae]KAE9044657.1 hypothetical protein PR002_g2667 [Phytophthora rubi]KAE9050263.1 hypothetical protein PR001_g2545 [Phytophthora rubi]KAE9206495.1 hypothetical protein PF005_g12976 [Phytophthora fragariae]KAE9224692.1 hypothetical protein PF004_g12135 [Phytophthora fragariae]